jgi:molybdopterin synthase catalytic subunit
MTSFTRGPIDTHALTEGVRSPHCGAVALFLGTVRDLTGEQVTAFLDYDAYAPMAEKKLAEIEAEARRRWPVGDIAIVHRLGRLEVGEVSVAVAVSCPHRAQAFEACRYAIDAVKELVPIWKRENWEDGRTEWQHPGKARNAERGTRSEPA